MARGRVRIVCSFCRKRKIKCNKGMPCFNCIKFGNSQCEYLIPPNHGPTLGLGKKTPQVRNIDQVDELKDRLKTLEQLVLRNGKMGRDPDNSVHDERMSLHESIRPSELRLGRVRKSLGPFRWAATFRLDPGLFRVFQILCKHHILRKWPPDALKIQITTSQGSVDFAMNQEFDLNILPSILPHKKAVWMLVSRFFGVVYPFIPFLDEYQFRDQLASLIGPESDEEDTILYTLSDTKSYTTMGTLLLVLRFANLSVFTCTGAASGSCFHNSAPELEYLSQVPVSPLLVQAAQNCLGHFNLMQDNSLQTIQLLLLFRIYNVHCPEKLDPDAKNNTLSAILNLLALGRWLNREPCEGGAKQDNLARKVWYAMLAVDTYTSAFSGNLLGIDRHSFDVSVPAFSPHALNCADLEMEDAVCSSLQRFDEVRELISDAVELTGRVSGTVSLQDLVARAGRLELKLNEFWSQIQLVPPLNGPEAFAKMFDCLQFLAINYCVMGIYVHLHAYHQKRGDHEIANHYQRKMAVLIASKLVPSLPRFLSELGMFVGSTDIFVTTFFFQCIQQAALFLWSLYINFNAEAQGLAVLLDIVTSDRDDGTYKALDLITRTLRELLVIISDALALTVTKYKYNERLLQMHNHIMEIAMSRTINEPRRKIETAFVVELHLIFLACVRDEGLSALKVTAEDNLYFEQGKLSPGLFFEIMQFDNIFLVS